MTKLRTHKTLKAFIAMPILGIFIWSLLAPSFSTKNSTTKSSEDGKQSICELSVNEFDSYAEENNENLEGDNFVPELNTHFQFRIRSNDKNSCLSSTLLHEQDRPFYLLYHRMKIDPMA